MKINARVVALCVTVFLIGCSEDSPVQPVRRPSTGFVSVTVLNNVDPVPNVEIELVGSKLEGVTDEEGNVLFEVAPGKYHVDASVCCIGPGWIEYHEPVEVVARKTVEIKLRACLECL